MRPLLLMLIGACAATTIVLMIMSGIPDAEAISGQAAGAPTLFQAIDGWPLFAALAMLLLVAMLPLPLIIIWLLTGSLVLWGSAWVLGTVGKMYISVAFFPFGFAEAEPALNGRQMHIPLANALIGALTVLVALAIPFFDRRGRVPWGQGHEDRGND